MRSIHNAGQSGGAAGPGDDSRLLAGLRAGDLECFEQIFRRHHPALHALAAALVASDDVAADLVSDVFVRIWGMRATLAIRGQLGAYLRACVRNAALNHVSRTRRLARIHAMAQADGWSPGVSGMTSPDDEFDHVQLEVRLATAIAELPDRCGLAFRLHREEGLTQNQIAATMGVSPRTVENHIARAVRILRSALLD